MPGIEDVQPKQITTLGQPIVGGVVEPAATPGAVEKLIGAFRTGQITTQDIMERSSARTVAKERAELQLAQEAASPEAVEARKAQLQAATDKMTMERETALSKDFVGAYLRYNLPLKKADGKPDYTGMAEVGQKYADMERKLKFAEMGLTGTPRTFIDDKGRTRTVNVNAFGEDITMVPGKSNPLLTKYQKIAQDARSFLLQNDNEPEVPEGAKPPVLEVTPKHIEDQPPAPMITAIAPEPFQYVPEGSVQTAPTVAVEPKAAPAAAVVVEKPVITPPVTPGYVSGEGLITGAGDFKPDAFMNDTRKTELLDAWNKKAGNISSFRATVGNYRAKPDRAITTQDDIALATDALIIAAPGGTAGGRGMEGMRITRLEDTQPLLEQLYGIKGHILKEHVFEKGTRERLIEATERKAREMEKLAGGVIKQSAERLTEQGYDPEKFLYPAEKGLLESSKTATVPGAPAGGSVAMPITLSSGRKLRMVVTQ